MSLGEVPRFYRRAMLIYLIAIVIPACGLLWLGIQSFERQRQALATLGKEKLETQLKLAAKLEAVGRVAGSVAHDFNNLLTVINGCAQLLDEEIASLLEDA